MKILIISNKKDKLIVESLEERKDLTFVHHILNDNNHNNSSKDSDASITTNNTTPSPLVGLKNSAIIADQNSCDWVLDIQNSANVENINSIIDEIITTEPPYQLIVSDAKDDISEESPYYKKIVLMLQLLTGEKICGFRNKLRVYPTELLLSLNDAFYSNDFFYIDVLIKASKAGYKIKNSPIKNFKQIDLLELPPKKYLTKQLFKALLPIRTKRVCKRNFQKEKFKEFIFHPFIFLKFLLKENATPGGLAAAAATGMFIGTLPLLGLHTATIIYVSIKLRLNKVLSINISHLCMPPFVPFACIEIGHLILNGEWLDFRSFQTVVKAPHLRILEWILGALILAPINGLVFAGITYIIAYFIKKRVKK